MCSGRTRAKRHLPWQMTQGTAYNDHRLPSSHRRAADARTRTHCTGRLDTRRSTECGTDSARSKGFLFVKNVRCGAVRFGFTVRPIALVASQRTSVQHIEHPTGCGSVGLSRSQNEFQFCGASLSTGRGAPLGERDLTGVAAAGSKLGPLTC